MTNIGEDCFYLLELLMINSFVTNNTFYTEELLQYNLIFDSIVNDNILFMN